MEFVGTVLQPNFREKEKRFKATIASLESKVAEYANIIIEKDLRIEHLESLEKELKEEIKQVKIRHRNFKARVTGKE